MADAGPSSRPSPPSSAPSSADPSEPATTRADLGLEAAGPDAHNVGHGSRRLARTRNRRRALHFPDTAQPEIIRANQKDHYYLAELRNRVEDVLRGVMGTRWLHTNSAEVDAGSNLAYFSLTTLLGCQTLGEEYCDIIQYSVSTRKVPSILRRISLVFLHVLGPYFLSRLYTRLRTSHAALRASRQSASSSSEDERRRQDEFDSLFEPASSTTSSVSVGLQKKEGRANRWRERSLDLICKFELPRFETIVKDHLRAVHLATFYLWGRYYHWSKRFSGVRYLSAQSRSPLSSSSSPPSYEVLGALMAIQLLVRLSLSLHSARKAASPSSDPSDPSSSHNDTPSKPSKKRASALVDGRPISKMQFDPDEPDEARGEADEEGEGVVDKAEEGSSTGQGQGQGQGQRRCTLCLQARVDPTSTGCGHVFCWTCIVGWAREKPECPLCRQSITMATLLPIYNF